MVKVYGYKISLIISITVIAIILCSGCGSSVTPKAEIKTGHHAGAGLVAEKDGLIYFINPADYKKIYSYDEQSGKYARISDDSSRSIFIDDDWIYYQNLFSNNLSRIRLDGTDLETLNIAPISYTSFFSYFISDGWIYYKWWDFDNNSGFYRLSADGENLEVILENVFRVKDFIVAGDWIYYTSEDDNYICRIRTDGGDPVRIGNYDAKEIIFYEGYLYFKDNEFKLHRVNIESGEAIKLSEKEMVFFYNSPYSYLIYDDWIYYTNRDDNFSLYKMRTDGSDSQIISKDKASMIHIINSWIYYYNFDDKGRIYRIKTDGSQTQNLFNDVRSEQAYDASKPLVVSDYYINFDTDWIINGKPINLGMYESDILQLLGIPVEITDKDCDEDYSNVCYYEIMYPEAVISFVHHQDEPENARLFSLETDSPLAIGPRAIRVGDTFSQVLEKLPDDGNPLEEAFDYQKDMYEYYHILYGSNSVSGPICEIYYDENKSPIEMRFRDGIGDTSASLYASYLTLHFKDGLVSSMIMGHSCWCRL